jgi:hypothetical protein
LIQETLQYNDNELVSTGSKWTTLPASVAAGPSDRSGSSTPRSAAGGSGGGRHPNDGGDFIAWVEANSATPPGHPSTPAPLEDSDTKQSKRGKGKGPYLLEQI